MHTTPFHEEPIYHAHSEGPNLDDVQDQLHELIRELRANREKKNFGKNARDLSLVPNVKLPAKFKVPDFEKYKGDTCPETHLTLDARRMSAYTDNHQVLIYFFQDSLTGASLKWYMGLNNTEIRTFEDLGEAFVRNYCFNMDMAPDRDQLRSLSQQEKETFKEYAQRRRGLAAQISPPLEEKEMTKIFLKTLGPFFHERMVASAPTDFTEMVSMGMRLEKGVREGRLIKESTIVEVSKKFNGNFIKKKESSVSVVSRGFRKVRHQHVAAIAPVTSTPAYYQP